MQCTETITSDVKYTTNLINIFLKCLNDTSFNIKKYCLKGLTVVCQKKQIWVSIKTIAIIIASCFL